jgi:NADPH:quinone reductase-like Zn-dependent oxidoreductase
MVWNLIRAQGGAGSKTMKAVVIDGYGGSDRLRLCELPDSQPGPGEIVVRVRAAGVNPADWKIRQGQLRLFLRPRFPYILGGDVAGEVLATGAGTTRFRPGDPIVAFVDPARGGGYAEIAAVQESAAALKPQSLSFVEAASLPIAAVTALQALRDKGGLHDGGSALINGGAGGVGHFAVQIAKALGARTAATCGPLNVAYVVSLGADLAIDYSREDFTRRPERYDVVFDAVAMSSFAACRHLLNPGGAYVTTLPGVSVLFWGCVQSTAGLLARVKTARFLIVRPEEADLAFLGRLADGGHLRPTIARTFPLECAREAQEVSEAGHTRGKIVLEL